MYPGSNPELVAAVSRHGGLGIVQPLSLTHLYGHDFREGLRLVRKLSEGKPFGVNFTIVPNKKYKVVSCRVCKDRYTGDFLSYAYDTHYTHSTENDGRVDGYLYR